MRVLVTGAAGMLATAIVESFREGHEVVARNRKELDITANELVEATLGSMRPEVVINAAAFTRVDECEIKPALAFAVNAEGPMNLAVACSRIGARLVQISTDYVFDGRKDSPYFEDDLPCPLSVYGLSKLRGEENVRRYADDFTIVRTQWLYGERGRHFVQSILTQASEKEELQVVNDQRGSPTYARDLSSVIRTLVEGGHQGVYHAVNSGSCTWYEFALEVLRLLRVQKRVIPITTEMARRPARRPANSVLDCGRLREDAGVVLRPWPQALAQYLSRLPSH